MAFAAVLMVPWAVYDLRQARLTAASWRVLVLAGFFLALHFAPLEHIPILYERYQLCGFGDNPASICHSVWGTAAWEIPTRRAWVGPALAISGSAVVALGGNSEGASRLAGKRDGLRGSDRGCGLLLGGAGGAPFPWGRTALQSTAAARRFSWIAALIFRQPLTGLQRRHMAKPISAGVGVDSPRPHQPELGAEVSSHFHGGA